MHTDDMPCIGPLHTRTIWQRFRSVCGFRLHRCLGKLLKGSSLSFSLAQARWHGAMCKRPDTHIASGAGGVGPCKWEKCPSLWCSVRPPLLPMHCAGTLRLPGRVRQGLPGQGRGGCAGVHLIARRAPRIGPLRAALWRRLTPTPTPISSRCASLRCCRPALGFVLRRRRTVQTDDKCSRDTVSSL